MFGLYFTATKLKHYMLSHVTYIIAQTNVVKYTRFLDSDRSLNRKRERFKVFEVEPGSNRDDVIINLIIILI